MTKQIAFKSRLLRDGHVVAHPVTGAYVPAILLEGEHFMTYHGAASWTTGQGHALTSATAVATNITAPDGSATAHRIQANAQAGIYHGVRLSPLQGNGDWMGYLGEAANRLRAFSFDIKPGTGITAIEVRTLAENGSGYVTDVFDMSAGTKTSGSSKIYIEPSVPDDPAYAGWWRIFSYGLQFPSSGTISNVVDVYMIKGALGYFAGPYFTGAGEYVDFWGSRTENGVAQCQLGFWNAQNVAALWGTSPGAEQLTLPLPTDLEKPRSMTLWAQWLERGNAVVANAPSASRESGILRIGDMQRTAANSLEVKQTATGFTATLNNGGTTSVSTLALTPTRDQMITLRVTLDALGVVQLHGAINANAETAGTEGAEAGLPATWNDPMMTVNCLGKELFGDMSLLALKARPGLVPAQIMAL